MVYMKLSEDSFARVMENVPNNRINLQTRVCAYDSIDVWVENGTYNPNNLRIRVYRSSIAIRSPTL
jgi:hypothetical protein